MLEGLSTASCTLKLTRLVEYNGTDRGMITQRQQGSGNQEHYLELVYVAGFILPKTYQ